MGWVAQILGRMVSITYHMASSRVSTNIWYFSFFVWIAIVDSQEWHIVNSTNYKRRVLSGRKRTYIILCASK